MRVGWNPFSSNSSIAVLKRDEHNEMLPKVWHVQYTNEATLVIPAATSPNVLTYTTIR